VSELPRLFVLDTNVLMHDPVSMFRFQEHDVFLPMVVIEELDAAKKGVSEVARNARQASRLLDELIGGADRSEIEAGLQLPAPGNGPYADAARSGRLFLQTDSLSDELPAPLPGNKQDNTILGTTITLQKLHPDKLVALVSKDINLRIKARILGVNAEDYYNDKVLDDVNLLYSGVLPLPYNFWDSQADQVTCWQESGRTFYKLTGPVAENCFPKQCLYEDREDGFEGIAQSSDFQTVTVPQSSYFYVFCSRLRRLHHFAHFSHDRLEIAFFGRFFGDPSIEANSVTWSD